MSQRARPPVGKTIAQCKISGWRGGVIRPGERSAAGGRDRARRKHIPVTLAPVRPPLEAKP